MQTTDWSQRVDPLGDDDWPHRSFRLGFDTHARLLKSVVLVFDGGEELMIQAMPARRQYWDLVP